MRRTAWAIPEYRLDKVDHRVLNLKAARGSDSEQPSPRPLATGIVI